jgi:hypothetical protein
MARPQCDTPLVYLLLITKAIFLDKSVCINIWCCYRSSWHLWAALCRLLAPSLFRFSLSLIFCSAVKQQQSRSNSREKGFLLDQRKKKSLRQSSVLIFGCKLDSWFDEIGLCVCAPAYLCCCCFCFCFCFGVCVCVCFFFFLSGSEFFCCPLLFFGGLWVVVVVVSRSV